MNNISNLYQTSKFSFFIFVFFFINNNALSQKAYFDLSEDKIHIQTNFNGKEIIIFGILDPKEDTIVAIKGPKSDTKLTKKEKIFGFWINTKKIIYKELPTIFFLASTSPVEKILSNETIIKEKLNYDKLLTNIITQRNFIEQKNIIDWNKNLIEIKKTQNLYKKYDLKNVEDKLFQTRVFFPAISSPGDYIVTIYQIKNNVIIDKKIKKIVIDKSGIGNKIYLFAQQEPAIYGIISILLAVFAGLIAATAFRRI